MNRLSLIVGMENLITFPSRVSVKSESEDLIILHHLSVSGSEGEGKAGKMQSGAYESYR